MTTTIKSLEKQFNESQAEINSKFDLVLKALEEKNIEVETPVKEETDESVLTVVPASLSSSVQALFIQYFDPADGFTLKENFPRRNRLTLSVPKDFSNADPSHWTQHNEDLRSTRPIIDNYEINVERYLQLWSKNLNYDRNIMLKKQL